MKRKHVMILFITMAFICFCTISAKAIPTASLNLLDTYITLGESFDIEVMADGDGIGQELLAFGFDVDTPGSILSYTGYDIESGFNDDSDPFNPDNVAGSVFTGISEDDVLLASRVCLLACWEADLAIEILLGDDV